MIWAKEETMSRAEIEALQLERLKETVARVYEKVAPYRQKMEAAGVTPEDIQTLKDLAKLPFITKQDMRDNYPFGLFAVPKDGPNAFLESQPWEELPPKMWRRFVLDMGCLLVRWDFISDWKIWAQRWFPPPLEIQRNRLCI